MAPEADRKQLLSSSLVDAAFVRKFKIIREVPPLCFILIARVTPGFDVFMSTKQNYTISNPQLLLLPIFPGVVALCGSRKSMENFVKPFIQPYIKPFFTQYIRQFKCFAPLEEM